MYIQNLSFLEASSLMYKKESDRSFQHFSQIPNQLSQKMGGKYPPGPNKII